MTTDKTSSEKETCKHEENCFGHTCNELKNKRRETALAIFKDLEDVLDDCIKDFQAIIDTSYGSQAEQVFEKKYDCYVERESDVVDPLELLPSLKTKVQRIKEKFLNVYNL